MSYYVFKFMNKIRNLHLIVFKLLCTYEHGKPLEISYLFVLVDT